MPHLSARTLRPWLLPPWWDAHVAQAGALWELQAQRIRFNALRAPGRLRPIAVYRAGNGNQPVAQCLATRAPSGWVIDHLILSEGQGGDWSRAMQAVLAHLGSGIHRYGHNWSLEPSREDDLRAMAGVRVGQVQPIHVHAVENGLWANDAAWLAAISTNVKRNLKRAREAAPVIETRWHEGRAALRELGAVVAMRDATMLRLQTPISRPAEAIRRGLSWLAAPGGLTVGVAAAGKRTLAACVGYRVGATFFYAMGGSAADNGGGSWTLLIDAILRWRAAHPEGRFVLGYLDESLAGVQREGLLRQRQSLRKSDFPTALIEFEFLA